MAKMTPAQEASYALDYGVSRDDLKPAAQAEFDLLKAERANAVAAGRPPSAPRVLATSRAKTKPERAPSSVIMLGTLLGWGPWSAGIGAWRTFGNSGYTFNGQNASTSAVHGICQAGAAAFQPGICGSVDAHYAFGVALMVIGVLAFLGGLIGMFAIQQKNPRAWGQAWTPFVAGLIFGVFAVAVAVIMAIARGAREGAASPAAGLAQSAVTASSSPLTEESGGMTAAPVQMRVEWRVGPAGGWEWLASDGRWYPQQLAPAGLLPPAPPPPSRGPAPQAW